MPKQLAEAQTKLKTVERQLDISQKPETEENAADAPIPYPVENARHRLLEI